MRLIRIAFSRLGSFVRFRELDGRLEEEIEEHLQMLTESYVAQGLTPKQARQKARREFGAVEVMKESHRDRRSIPFVETLGQDLRLAWRGLRKAKAMTAIAVFSLALAIGANTALYSYVQAILLATLPIAKPEELSAIRSTNAESPNENTAFSYDLVKRLEKDSKHLRGVFGEFTAVANLQQGDGVPVRVTGELVTANFFSTLGVHAARGRLLDARDMTQAGANPVCVISYKLWQERFQGDPNILKRMLRLNNRGYQIIGVTQEGFAGLELQSRFSFQVPVTETGEFMGQFPWNSPTSTFLNLFARTKSGTDREHAASELTAAMRTSQPEDFARYPSRFTLHTASQGLGRLRASYEKPLLVLLVIVVIVLLIACANLANLLIARAMTRQREFAVQLSLGATRWRMIRQSMTESLLIAFVGGSFGLLIAHNTLAAIKSISSEQQMDVAIDLRVLLFCSGLTFLTALLFGAIPAWQAARPRIAQGLKGDAWGENRPRLDWRQLLVASQVALGIVLLFGAGLFLQTLRSLRNTDLGFDTQHLVTMTLNPQFGGYRGAALTQINQTILSRVKSIPGVTSASLAFNTPLSGSSMTSPIAKLGQPHDYRQQAEFNNVEPEYFKATGVRFVAGRDFSSADITSNSKVAIVNQAFVHALKLGPTPVGQQIEMPGDGKKLQIIGVVQDSRLKSIREPAAPSMFIPFGTTLYSAIQLLVRSNGQPDKVVDLIRQQIASIDRKIPVFDIQIMNARVETLLAKERLLAMVSLVFAGIAVVLSTIGIYGVIAYSVTRRTREIGIRLAVGAQRQQIASLFLRQGTFVLLTGILIGVPIALLLTRSLKSFLYGLPPNDPATLVGATALLTGAALLAAVVPVRRAMKVNPVTALRHE